LKLWQGKKLLDKNEVETDEKGRLALQFTPPAEAVRNLLLTVDSVKSGKGGMRIPLLLSRTQQIDLQFLPEGGRWIGGWAVKMAFKAVGENGKGIDVEGNILDGANQVVTSFHSLHDGMGSFYMIPTAGEHYTARITSPAGNTRLYPLPVVQTTGTLLKITNSPSKDSLEVQLGVSDDIAQRADSFLLAGQSAGDRLCYALKAILPRDGLILKVPKTFFPTGVARFTLLDSRQHPVNERLVFISHPGKDPFVHLQVTQDKSGYQAGDSIALHVHASDAEGHPLSGSFSIAVTDDALVKKDEQQDNIVSYFHLSSLLKGFIEDPAYYFRNDDPVTRAALDNLLLTQGWVGYDWEEVRHLPGSPAYEAEPAFRVKGRVLNAFNKPVPGSGVLLVSMKPTLIKKALTDEAGSFSFSGFPAMDTMQFILEAKNPHGKSFNVGFEMDEFKPPIFAAEKWLPELPWYVNMDTTLHHYVLQSNKRREEKEQLMLKGHVLKEVTVTAQKAIPHSYNLNGPGGADIVIDDKDLEKAGKKTVLQVLEQDLKGFEVQHLAIRVGRNSYIPPSFYVKHVKTFMVVDGVLLNTYYPTLEEQVDKLNTVSAEEIRGIEVMTSDMYADKYKAHLLDPGAVRFEYVFIEITTRSGKSIWQKKTPGVYIYKPLPMSWPRRFYNPRYIPESDSLPPLPRATVYWSPDVETDSSGNATVSFFAGSTPSNYSFIIQGADMMGRTGYQTGKIVIANRDAITKENRQSQ